MHESQDLLRLCREIRSWRCKSKVLKMTDLFSVGIFCRKNFKRWIDLRSLNPFRPPDHVVAESSGPTYIPTNHHHYQNLVSTVPINFFFLLGQNPYFLLQSGIVQCINSYIFSNLLMVKIWTMNGGSGPHPMNLYDHSKCIPQSPFKGLYHLQII